jgi:Family of unknown function (DUF6941)
MEDAPGAAIPGEHPEVRMFVVADHAATAPDGKLYLNGAGVDQVLVAESARRLPTPLYLAIRIRVPWHMTSETLRLRVRALDADRRPFGPDPLVDGQMEVGRAPGARPGDELAFNVAVQVSGMPVPEAGPIHFHLELAGHVLAVLPLKINVRP